jgi:hypothetical protein
MINFKQFREQLDEARKNPEMNPKVSAYEALLPYKDDDNAFIHFTNLNKLGINPLSGFETPVGVYAYPLKQVWDLYKVDKAKSLSVLPFGSDRAYIQLFKWNGKGKLVSDLKKDYTSADYDSDMRKLRTIYKDIQSKTDTSKAWNALVKGIFKHKLEIPDDFEEGNVVNITHLLDTVFGSGKVRRGITIKNSPRTKPIFDDILKAGKVYMKDKKSDSNWDKFSKKFELYHIEPPRRMAILFVSADELEYEIEDAIRNSDKYRTWEINVNKPAIYRELKPLQDAYNNSLFNVDDIINAATEKTRNPSPATCFWNVTRWLSNYGIDPNVRRFTSDVMFAKDGHHRQIQAPTLDTAEIKAGSRQWGNLLRKLGYAGFVDRKADGIIHPAEPCQAVFTGMDYIELIDTVLNKDYAKLKHDEEVTLENLKNASHKNLMDYIMNWNANAIDKIDMKYLKWINDSTDLAKMVVGMMIKGSTTTKITQEIDYIKS